MCNNKNFRYFTLKTKFEITRFFFLLLSAEFRSVGITSFGILPRLNVQLVLLKSRYAGEGSPALIVESFTRTPRFLLFGFAPGRDAQKPSANLSACRLFAEDNGSKWARSKVAGCYSEFDSL